MLDAATNFDERAADGIERSDNLAHQSIHIAGTSVGQSTLGQRPDAFIRIELRRIAGKILHMQAGMAMSKSPQGLPFVNLAIIQQRDDVPAKMTQQMSEEFADLKSADIVQIKAVIQAQALNPGADRNSRNGRDFIPASEMTENGRLSARRPGLQHVRNQEEPRFVEKDEMGAQPCGVFFTCGQRCRFQRSMASSFRSRARRSGF